MAQFTAYQNKNTDSKKLFPYLLNAQTDLLSDLQTLTTRLSRAPANAKRR